MSKNKNLIFFFLSIIIIFSSVYFLSFPLNLQNEEIPKKQESSFSGNVQAKVNILDYPFVVGEKLIYGIYSAGIKVGTTTITYLGTKQISGQVVSYITVEAKAPGYSDFEKIYGNIYDSTPVRIEREISLFGKKEHIVEEYDLINNEVLITRNSNDSKAKLIKSSKKINNIILLLYQLRFKKGYKVGERLEFNLPTKKLVMLADSQRRIGVPIGSFNSIYFRSIPAKFKVWIRSDKDYIPLRIQGAIGFGHTYLALISKE